MEDGLFHPDIRTVPYIYIIFSIYGALCLFLVFFPYSMLRFTKNVALASFKASIPVLLGYLTMGAAAGILLTSQTGLGAFWAFLTSATSVSGALQFMAVDMFANHTPLLTVALVTLSINIRYALYGLPLIERWKGIPILLKLYLILSLTDETFALETENKYPPGEDSLTYCFLISLFDHIYWVTGVVAGSLAGGLLNFNTKGIDFAMTALFIVILMDQLQEKQTRIPAGIGGICAVIGLLIYPANMLVPSLLLILAAILLFRRRLEVANA